MHARATGTNSHTTRPKKSELYRAVRVCADARRQLNDVRATMLRHAMPISDPLPSPSLGILSVFRNEAQGITEWLLHHTLEGVTQFVLLNEESDDGGEELVKKFAATQPTIEVRVVGAMTSTHGAQHDQVVVYNRHIGLMRTDWVMVIDLDEFVYARQPFATVPDYLATVPMDVSLIGLPWKRFGSSAIERQPVSIIASFLLREQSKPESMNDHSQIKSLVRLSALQEVGGSAGGGADGDDGGGSGDSAKSAAARNGTALSAFHGNATLAHQHRATYRHHVVLPNGRRAATAMGGKAVQGPLSPAELDSWHIHLNHYAVQSCEFYTKVRMTRGTVTRTQYPLMRNFLFMALQEKECNRKVDDELRRKRGSDEWTQRLPPSRPWPKRATGLNAKYQKHLDPTRNISCEPWAWPQLNHSFNLRSGITK